MWLSGRNLVVHRKPGKGVSIQQVKVWDFSSGFRVQERKSSCDVMFAHGPYSGPHTVGSLL